VRKFAAVAMMALTSGAGVVAGAGAAHASINVADNWCAAPWSWPGPVSENNAPFSYDACNYQTNATNATGNGSGINIGANWCAAPWDWEGPLSDNNAAFPYLACFDQRNDAPVG